MNARMATGAVCGALLLAFAATLIRPLCHPPTGGVGFVTVQAYPKSFDYALVALIGFGAMAGALAASRKNDHVWPLPSVTPRGAGVATGAVVVFLTMLVVHDHPYALMDPFHEGEHLTPGFLMKSGERPFTDIFLLHGLAVDGGLDALVLGDPPSPRRVRRLETVLDAATLALLVPIAAEVCATPAGIALAVVASLCGVAAGQLPVFPYFRLLPVLLAALGLLRYCRSGRSAPLMLAFIASTLGMLWSLDTGAYALTATVLTMAVLRATRSDRHPIPSRRLALMAAVAAALPFGVLLMLGGGIGQFLVDSFITIPRAIDAVWSLPAPAAPKWSETWRWLSSEAARFYLPPAFYGLLLAVAWRTRKSGDVRGAARVFIVATASLFVFRTALGRCSWSHTRFAVPLLGIAIVAFAIEPLWAARRRIAALVVLVAAAILLEAGANASAGAKMLVGWRARQVHSDLVPYPFATGRGIYTTRENAADLAALNGFIDSVAGPGGTFLDFSGERALYYLLQRKPPVRCPDIPMLSSPALGAEAMAQLRANPPACVVVKGIESLASFDGVPNDVRVPELARWIESEYPRRVQIGRFVVAAPAHDRD